MSGNNFQLIDQDLKLVHSMSVKLNAVLDVGRLPGNIIRFQFPPVIKSDSKSGKWHELYNSYGFEPKYQYQGAKPREIELSTTYVIGGPPIHGAQATMAAVQNQIRIWKKYFYAVNFRSGQGRDLPIWRIEFMGGRNGLIPFRGKGSAWRCLNYRISYSNEWITEGQNSHPIVTEISVRLVMSTKVDVTGSGQPKQDHGNLDQFAFAEWY